MILTVPGSRCDCAGLAVSTTWWCKGHYRPSVDALEQFGQLFVRDLH